MKLINSNKAARNKLQYVIFNFISKLMKNRKKYRQKLKNADMEHALINDSEHNQVFLVPNVTYPSRTRTVNDRYLVVYNNRMAVMVRRHVWFKRRNITLAIWRARRRWDVLMEGPTRPSHWTLLLQWDETLIQIIKSFDYRYSFGKDQHRTTDRYFK